MRALRAILVGNGTMGKRHRKRFEACGVQFVAVVDNQNEFDGTVDKLNVDLETLKSFITEEINYVNSFLDIPDMR